MPRQAVDAAGHAQQPVGDRERARARRAVPDQHAPAARCRRARAAPPRSSFSRGRSCGRQVVHATRPSLRANSAISLRYTCAPMSRRFVPAVLALVVLGACSEPPNKERQQAEARVAAARAADAAIYAPEGLQAAEAALQKYDEAVAQRDYRQALNLALEARDQAYEAAKQAGDAKDAAAEPGRQADRRNRRAHRSPPTPAWRARRRLDRTLRPPIASAPRCKTATTAVQEARSLHGAAGLSRGDPAFDAGRRRASARSTARRPDAAAGSRLAVPAIAARGAGVHKLISPATARRRR